MNSYREFITIKKKTSKCASINAACDQSKLSVLETCDWSHWGLYRVNFSQIAHNNQISKKDCVFSNDTSVKFKRKLLSAFFLVFLSIILSANYTIFYDITIEG